MRSKGDIILSFIFRIRKKRKNFGNFLDNLLLYIYLVAFTKLYKKGIFLTRFINFILIAPTITRPKTVSFFRTYNTINII